MSDNEFNEFVNRRSRQVESAPAVDWDKRRDDWLRDVETLYSRVESMLSEYLSDGRIEKAYEPITINEERLGSYGTRKLMLRIGLDEIEFVPVGTVIFGAWGRVDLVGPAGRAKLVLVERKATSARLKVTIVDPDKPVERSPPAPREEWDWKIAGSPPYMTLTDLTAETLRGAILEVANG